MSAWAKANTAICQEMERLLANVNKTSVDISEETGIKVGRIRKLRRGIYPAALDTAQSIQKLVIWLRKNSKN